MASVLVIEDHSKLLAALKQGLEDAGFRVLTASDSRVDLNIVNEQSIDIIVLDRMLPGGDGANWLQRFRAAGGQQPVLMLTARDHIQDRIAGLDAGADDYLVKPFDFGELLARLRALLRRPTTAETSVLRAREIEVDRLQRRVTVAGGVIELSPREFELLEYLMLRANQTVTREQLSRELWKETQLLTNVVDVTVSQLRRKLERLGTSPLIHTVRGQGYEFRGDA